MKPFNLDLLTKHSWPHYLHKYFSLFVCLKLAKSEAVSSRNTFKITEMGIQIEKELCI